MKRKILILMLVIVVLGLAGCEFGEELAVETINYVQENTEKNIIYMTSGVIPGDSSIAVMFEEKQVDKGVLGKPIKGEDIFEFEPGLEGSVFWSNQRTIVFEPEEPLTEQRQYVAILNLHNLFPEQEDVTPGKHMFDFETTGQFIKDFSADFDVVGADESSLEYKGYLQLAHEEDLRTVRNALVLSDSEKEYNFQLNTEDNKSFTFVSDRIVRGDSKIELNFKIKQEVLDLEKDFLKNYSMSPVDQFGVERVEEVRVNESSYLRAVFTDPLDPDFDYTPFLTVSPALDFDMQVEGREMLLRGDFEAGSVYELKFLSGLPSALEGEMRTDREFQKQVEIEDELPKIEFSNPGSYLTSGKNQRVAFRTMNLERVRVTVKEVEKDNLIDFLEYGGYDFGEGEQTAASEYNFRSFGQILASEVVEVGTEKNMWRQMEIDLSEIISGDSGLYIIELDFNGNDALYFPSNWSNRQIRRYISSEGSIYKNFILSDLGVLAKKTDDEYHVFVTDIMEARPLEKARVQLKDRYDRVQETGYTDEEGRCVLPADSSPSYIEVSKHNDKTVIRLADSRQDYSLFDTGGTVAESGIKAFLYLERGVYRPGDEINLSVIARDSEGVFPDNQPISLRLYNPQNQLIKEIVNSEGKDGFYSFNFATEEDALTGNWVAELEIAGETFSKVLKIEQIVPYEIEVDIATEQETLQLGEELDFSIQADYLFGTPASGLDTETRIRVTPYEKKIDRFSDFVFTNQSRFVDYQESSLIEAELDEAGNVELSWELPEFDYVPSALKAEIDTRVFQRGGRPVLADKNIPVAVYDRYVGIKELESEYVERGSQIEFDIVLSTEEGEPLSEQELEYRLYRKRRYWWWDYRDRQEFLRNFMSDESTEVIEQGTLHTDDNGFAVFQYDLDDYGQLMLEVEDPESGHSAGYFFRGHWRGAEVDSSDTAEITNIKSDKDKYNPGDEAEVILETPEEGRILLTVEKGGEILSQQWQEVDGERTVISLPIEDDYVPNIYVYAAVFQPYSRQDNDLPLRMFGVLPLEVTREDQELEFELNAPDEIAPGSEFSVDINAEKESRFTVAIVDEGLLGITDFSTPNPGDYFFAKEQLAVESYDHFSDIIGLTEGYIYDVFSIGGAVRSELSVDVEEDDDSGDDRRFEPVTFFEGPVKTDQQGNLDLSFEMPNYFGRVRVMAIGAAGESYGSQEKGVVVSNPLMILPTLPRVLAPEDKIEIPVTVFYQEEEAAEVEVELRAEGYLSVTGSNKQVISFDGPGEKEVYFEAQADNALGEAQVFLEATGGGFQAEETTNLTVRPVMEHVYLTEDKVVETGEEVQFDIPEEGLRNSGSAQLSILLREGLNINHRLKWLIRYPFGCIEQTTSSVLAQLFLPEILDFTEEELKDMDENIDAAVERLRLFQTRNGGFSYWPHGSRAHLWGTNYAGHFLVEARNRGYHVPDDLWENWLAFQKDQARDGEGNLLTQTYRLYLLALAEEPQISAMNYLRESQLDSMGNTSGYYLAAAYEISGDSETAENIFDNFSPEVEENNFAASFGSEIRNMAIMLEISTLLEKEGVALELYSEIAETLSSEQWLSTQESGYSLMAIARYLTEITTIQDKVNCSVILPDGEKVEYQLEEMASTIPLDDYLGQTVTLVNQSDNPFFGAIEWEGIPKRDNLEPVNRNLDLEVTWLDEDGKEINPQELTQGTTFWGHFRFKSQVDYSLTEIALSQILPSGWEIENIRLHDSSLPAWMDNYNLDEEDYLDIRDDRINWFFDTDGYGWSYDFVVKINAVTVGDFYLPPARAEAMYDNDYLVILEGREVSVIRNE